MADGSGKSQSVGTQISSKTGGHEETPLDPIRQGWEIHRGPTDYTHAVLPWIHEEEIAEVNWDRSYFHEYGFRMTSPYDPNVSSTPFDANSGAGTALGARLAGPSADVKFNSGRNVAYWDYYASMYKYYSVLGCRFKVRVENLSNEKFFVHQMYINDVRPPTASNWDMMIWPGVKSHIVQPLGRYSNAREIQVVETEGQNDDDDLMETTAGNTGSAFFSNPIGSSMIVMQGEYRPGDHSRSIHLDDQVSIYTSVSQNPSLSEVLFIRITPYDNASVPTGGNASNYNRPLSFNITVECEYLVEFKELHDFYKWPVTRNPIITAPNLDPTSEGGL